MKVPTRVYAALTAVLFSILVPITPAFASDDRTVDVVEITWNGASKPSASTQDVKNSIINSVSDSWRTFTTNENDAKARTINFVYGKTLETPLRLSTPLICEGSRFVSLMREFRQKRIVN